MSTASAAQARFMVTVVEQSPLHCLRAAAQRVGLAGIVESLAVGAAFADGERAGGPRFGSESRRGQRQGQSKNKQRAALRDGSRNDQNPLPRGRVGREI